MSGEGNHQKASRERDNIMTGWEKRQLVSLRPKNQFYSQRRKKSAGGIDLWILRGSELSWFNFQDLTPGAKEYIKSRQQVGNPSKKRDLVKGGKHGEGKITIISESTAT